MIEMRVQEFGQRNDHVILLLHGGGLSWWNYREAAQLLRKAIPGSQIEILPGLRYGDISINHPETYIRMLKEWRADHAVCHPEKGMGHTEEMR